MGVGGWLAIRARRFSRTGGPRIRRGSDDGHSCRSVPAPAAKAASRLLTAGCARPELTTVSPFPRLYALTSPPSLTSANRHAYCTQKMVPMTTGNQLAERAVAAGPA
jgi:hypothetical protein